MSKFKLIIAASAMVLRVVPVCAQGSCEIYNMAIERIYDSTRYQIVHILDKPIDPYHPVIDSGRREYLPYIVNIKNALLELDVAAPKTWLWEALGEKHIPHIVFCKETPTDIKSCITGDKDFCYSFFDEESDISANQTCPKEKQFSVDKLFQFSEILYSRKLDKAILYIKEKEGKHPRTSKTGWIFLFEQKNNRWNIVKMRREALCF